MRRTSIESIIKTMGYMNSKKLFRLSEINKCEELSWHTKRVLQAISPYAVYLAGGKVLVAFFDDLHQRKAQDAQGKIWNSQIPIIISDEGNMVKVYNGKSMELDKIKGIELFEMAQYPYIKCDEKNKFSYWNVTNSQVISLEFFGGKEKCLNDFLIENLQYITSELKNEYMVTFANKLILRILFTRYLIDRGINIGYEELTNDINRSRECFLGIVKDKQKLYELFDYLKERFNGNLFEMNKEEECEQITADTLNLVHNFLTGQVELSTGQLCLFPFYDFNIIPIELISNIYEILLGEEKQNSDKAFYTPEYLADYIVEQTVGTHLVQNTECSVLDPSCGSGIFLVKSLRKILEKNVLGNGYFQDKSEMNKLITSNIFGVDYNEEAVDVTIFSLYVTLFDYQDPKDLTDFKLPLLKGKNVLYGDFFDDDRLEAIKNFKFKFILGNPPWGRVKQELYLDYCKSRDVKLQDGEISIAFLLKVKEFANADSECSLIVPSKILYKGKKPSKDFRGLLLKEAIIQQVLELSAVRKQIFEGAIAPAAILSYRWGESAELHKLEYISLKPNKYLKLFNIVMIEPDDVKYVEQELLLNNDWLWKTLVYGGYWDFELISGLMDKYPSIATVKKEHGLLSGKGIQDHIGEGKDSTHLIGRKLISSDKCIGHFCINLDNVTEFAKEKIHRPREKELFEPPYVFFKKGADCTDYSIRAVYTEESIVYKEAVSCIKGSEENKNILRNITGLLNSSLFSYFNLMLGSSVGIEREQIFLKELEKFPYAYSTELVELVSRIQIATKNNEIVDGLQEKINKQVLSMYNLSDNPFVDYALKVQIPMLCGGYEAAACSINELRVYAENFSVPWKDRLKRGALGYKINLYPNIKGKFAAFEMIISDAKEEAEVSVINEFDNEIDLLTKFMIYKINDLFYQTKNVAEFNENSFIIVKAMESKNWHPAMAIKDSYSVLNSVLQGRGTEYDGI